MSTPLLFLSVATAFSDQPGSPEDNSGASNDSPSYSDPHLDSQVGQQAQDTRSER